jgi:hypothetical protein
MAGCRAAPAAAAGGSTWPVHAGAGLSLRAAIGGIFRKSAGKVVQIL